MPRLPRSFDFEPEDDDVFLAMSLFGVPARRKPRKKSAKLPVDDRKKHLPQPAS